MRNHPDQTDGASGPALSNAPQTGLPFSTPTAAQQPELAEADVADVQPMQIDPPGSGCNLAVAPCSTAAPAHHTAVAFVEPAAPRRSPRLRRSDCYGRQLRTVLKCCGDVVVCAAHVGHVACECVFLGLMCGVDPVPVRSSEARPMHSRIVFLSNFKLAMCCK